MLDMNHEQKLNEAHSFLLHTTSNRNFTRFERCIIAFLYWKMGDRLLEIIADRIHTIEMQTLHYASHGGYAKWFKEQRINRNAIAAQAKDWVPAKEVR